MTQPGPTLFDYADRYPRVPGRRRVDTSVEAADLIHGKAPSLRDRCMDVLRANPEGMTADEIAAELRVGILSIRPRVTELKRFGLIVDSGQRRCNASNRLAAVMRLPMFSLAKGGER